MTAPQPDEDRQRAQDRQTMDYPVVLERLPDVLRGSDDDTDPEPEPADDDSR